MATEEIKTDKLETNEKTGPKELNLEVKADVLKGVLKAFEKVADELKISFSKKGIEIRHCDPACVVLVEVKVDEYIFDRWIVDNVDSVGIDFDSLKGVLKLAKKGDVISLNLNDALNSISYTVGIHKGKLSLLDVASMETPKTPDLRLETTFGARVEDVSDFIARAGDISETVFIEILGGKVKFSSKSETAEAEMTLETKARGPDCTSQYSLEYLENIIKGIKGVSPDLKIWMGDKYPMKIEYPSFEGNGTFVVLLAPRIENA